MRHFPIAVTLLTTWLAGCGGPEQRQLLDTDPRPDRRSTAEPTYVVRAEQIEGCECDVYCPCPFQKDATFDQCRVVMFWDVKDGRHRETDLDGLVFGTAVTKSGKSIEESAGTWEGVILVPEQATAAQRAAIVDVLRSELGPAFARLDVRTAPIELRRQGERRIVKAGELVHLELTPLLGANGKVTVIENPPSPLVMPTSYCARAEVNRYDDGQTGWDFAGRNGYYGPVELRSDD